MLYERDDDPEGEAFHRAYDLIVGQLALSEAEFPPLSSVCRLDPEDRRPWMWRAAVMMALLGLGFVSGLVAAGSGDQAPSAGQFVPNAEQTDTTAVAAPAEAAYPTPTEAAIQAALADEPDLVAPRVTHLLVIFGDQTTIDLRAQVQTDNWCDWYGVVGTVQADEIEWRAGGPAVACDD